MNVNLRHVTLLNEVKQASTWFLSKKASLSESAVHDECFQQLLSSCVAIVQDGFEWPARADLSDAENAVVNECASNSSSSNSFYQRLLNDFELLSSLENIAPLPVEHSAVVTVLNAPEFLHAWTLRCLAAGSLSRCLQALVVKQQLLVAYYDVNAFLRQNHYATSFFICLTAVEFNQPNLLNQLDAVMVSNQPHTPLMTRRTSSQPNIASLAQSVSLHEAKEPPMTVCLASTPRQSTAASRCKRLRFRRVNSLSSLARPVAITTEITKNDDSSKSFKYTPATSTAFNSSPFGYDDELDLLPSTSACSKRSQGSNTLSSMASSDTTATTTTSNSQRIEIINCDDIKIWTDQSLEDKTQQASTPTTTKAAAQCVPKSKRTHSQKRASPLHGFLANLFGTPPTYTSWAINYASRDTAVAANTDSSVLDTFLPVNGKKLSRHSANLFQDDGISMLDYTTPTCTGRQETQTASAPLDIINGGSHKLSTGTGTANSTLSYESSSKSETQQSLTAFLQMSRYSHSSNNNTQLEKENAHFRISEVCITAIEHVKWAKQQQQQAVNASALNNSCHEALYLVKTSNAVDDVAVAAANEALPYATNCRDLHSAESVGLTLISKFNDQQLPKLTDLKWLVSEEDAPQQLLPMPTSISESPQRLPTTSTDAVDDMTLTATRGNKYWAPPRQQIIFTEHASPNRLVLLHKQHFRCAGCAMRVSKQYVQHFRYCTYLGKYHCTGCHRNQISAIPAKILQNWDFKCYPVSMFAYRLIEQMYTFPLFHVPDLNPSLYVKHKALSAARQRRFELKYVRNFIKLCRFATREQLYFDVIPEHITADPDIWSMCDFVDVQNSSMKRSIDELIQRCEDHIFNCVLCTGRGFVCEYCNTHQVLYPWQKKVVRCSDCGACFHKNCWKSLQPGTASGQCCRCRRLQERQSNNL